jgi:hypothetical protein
MRLVGIGLLLGCTAGLSVAFATAGWAALHGFADQAAPSRTPVGLLAPLCALSASAVLGWLCVATVLSALSGLPGRTGRHAAVSARRLAPALVRTGVAAALGGSLALASAASGGPARPGSAVTAGAHPGAADRPDGAVTRPSTPAPPTWTPGPEPTRSSASRADVNLVSSAGPPGRPKDEHVVVHRGDSLWGIAARHLPSDADDAAVARACALWYAANQAVIGADPDLLQPGQLLVRPPDP